MKKLLLTITLAAAVIAVLEAQSLEADLQRAVQKETVTGNGKAAIDEYKKIAGRAGSNKKVAAQALIHAAEAYQKMGDAEARKLYEEVLSKYADQQAEVAEAKARLAGMGESAAGDSGVKAVQVLEHAQGVNTNGISHDGRYLAYVLSGRSVAVRDLLLGTDRRVTGENSSANILLPVFTPDDRYIVYAWLGADAREIRVVAFDGSGERTILRMDDANTVPGAVSPDGKLIAAQIFRGGGKGNQLALISLDTGNVRVLKTLQSMDLRIGNFSPDGRWLVYSPVGSGGRETYVIETDGSSETRLISAGGVVGAAFFMPDGSRVVFCGSRSGHNELWSIRMSGGKPLDAPEPVGPAVGDAADLIGFAKNGALFFDRSMSMQSVYVADVDLTQGRLKSAPRRISDRFQDYSTFAPTWSADGKSLAYLSRRPSTTGTGEATFVVRDSESGRRQAVSASFGQLLMASQFTWSPDGKSLLLSGSGCRVLDIATGRISELSPPVQ